MGSLCSVGPMLGIGLTQGLRRGSAGVNSIWGVDDGLVLLCTNCVLSTGSAMSHSLGGCVDEWVLSLTLAAVMDGQGCFLHAYGSADVASACYGVFIRERLQCR